jgi:hypothetical protein
VFHTIEANNDGISPSSRRSYDCIVPHIRHDTICLSFLIWSTVILCELVFQRRMGIDSCIVRSPHHDDFLGPKNQIYYCFYFSRTAVQCENISSGQVKGVIIPTTIVVMRLYNTICCVCSWTLLCFESFMTQTKAMNERIKNGTLWATACCSRPSMYHSSSDLTFDTEYRL